MSVEERLLVERIRRRADLLGRYHRYTEMAQRRRLMPGHMNTRDALARAAAAWEESERCDLTPDGYGHHWVVFYRNGGGEMGCIHCGVPQNMDVTEEESYR